jgi:ribonuclease Z
MALLTGGSVILFDCGEGTQRQLLYTNVSFMKIDRIYISHLHGDHFFGLPGLVQTMGLNQRKDPLTILGPEGSKEHLGKILGAGYGFNPFEIRIRELSGDSSEEEGELQFTTAYVDHNVPSLAVSVQEKEKRGKFDREKAVALGVTPGPMFSRLTNGHKVEVEGRTISPEEVMGPPRQGRKFVYSGDTSPCDSVMGLARDADVLVYESTFDHSQAEKARDFKHSTNIQAAELARDANVKYLLLHHISPRYSAPEVEQMLSACRKVHPETHITSDLEELVLTAQGLKSAREM